MRLITLVSILCSTMLAASAAQAQAAHPDYSGTFLLDPAQSEDSPVVPQKLRYSLKQSGTEVVVDRTQTTPAGEQAAVFRYTLDGRPAKNDVVTSSATIQMSTVVTWEGDSPVFTSESGTGVHQVDKWTLLEGGKKLQIARTVAIGEQSATARMILVRQ